jgi:hypothetical protein
MLTHLCISQSPSVRITSSISSILLFSSIFLSTRFFPCATCLPTTPSLRLLVYSAPAVNTRMTAKSQAKSLSAGDAAADDNISISALPSVIGSTTAPLQEDHTDGGHTSSVSASASSSVSGSGSGSRGKKWIVVSALATGAFIGFLGGIALSKGTIPKDFNFNVR